jgi:hypothetical protein
MPLVNFSDTTPAAPSGAVNIKFQTDTSNNVSGYYTPGQTGWQSWTPVFSADAGTFALSNLYLNSYLQDGPNVYFQVRFAASTSSSSAEFLFFTLPTTVIAANNFAAIPPAIAETTPAGMSDTTLCPARVETGTNQVVIQRDNNAPWPAGSYLFAVSGFYRSS